MCGIVFLSQQRYYGATMLKQILDLHIHSKYSRACSKHLELPMIAKTCEIRGIDIVVTGDWTHPGWFAHMQEHLQEWQPGVYTLKDGSSSTKFLLGTEIASIKKHGDKTRRVHHLLFAPTLEVAAQFNTKLKDRGINLTADGRPIIGMISKDILQLMLETDERMVMIPAHAWTPWFGIFGSKGGYDSMEECYEDLTSYIFAIETGLSSDPLMNWHVSALDKIALVSNSDAHSPQKLGREANVFAFTHETDISYEKIMQIIREQSPDTFLNTIEFYPEEGKYHMDGHRDCKFSCEPEETKRLKGICPTCKKPLVVGVMNRVMELADRTTQEARAAARVPYKSLVPLGEIIADVVQKGVATKTVQTQYDALVGALGNEFGILLDAPLDAIASASSQQVALAIDRVRRGDIFIQPGYDGEFGVVKVFKDGESRGGPKQTGFDLS